MCCELQMAANGKVFATVKLRHASTVWVLWVVPAFSAQCSHRKLPLTWQSSSPQRSCWLPLFRHLLKLRFSKMVSCNPGTHYVVHQASPHWFDGTREYFYSWSGIKQRKVKEETRQINIIEIWFGLFLQCETWIFSPPWPLRAYMSNEPRENETFLVYTILGNSYLTMRWKQETVWDVCLQSSETSCFCQQGRKKNIKSLRMTQT